MEEAIKEALEKYEITIPYVKIEKLNIFLLEVIEKNKIIGLISQRDEKNIIERHLIDCLIPLKLNNFRDVMLNSKKILDIGSGGGFPAIPLAIAFEESNIILAESNKKKYEFLIWLKHKLRLANITIINERITQNHKTKYDLIIQRAVAKFDEILKVSMNILNKDGFFISWLSKEDALKHENLFNFIYNYNLNGRDFAICGVKKEK